MFAVACVSWEGNKWGLVGGALSSPVTSGSQDGKGVEDANELLEGEAKMIGPRDEGVVGEGVRSEAVGESAVPPIKSSGLIEILPEIECL